jgi:hypothetical protein
MEVNPSRWKLRPPLNFHQPGLADGSYVIFVGGRQKLCKFHLVTFIGQGPMEDKMKPTKKVFFRGFWLILTDESSAVSCTGYHRSLNFVITPTLNYCHKL